MAYHGTNDDRERADEIHAAYIEKMKRFVDGLPTAVTKSGCSVVTTCGMAAWWIRSSPTCGRIGPISSRRVPSPNP